MTEAEALAKLIPPGQRRPWKKHNREGVMQIIVTTSCDLRCANCTQLANIKRPHWEMSVPDFRSILKSLKGYWGVVALFGGNACLANNFPDYCWEMREAFPKEQLGLWSNNIFGWGGLCRETFGKWNLNVHGNKKAYDNIRATWPEANPFGLGEDESSHAPVFVGMDELDQLPFMDGSRRENTEENRWELISACDLNYHWSGAATVVAGQPMGYFCEIAAAQALYRQDPSSGMPIAPGWWERPMSDFATQAREHCHGCSMPLKARGELSQKQDGITTISPSYEGMRLKGNQHLRITSNADDIDAFAVNRVTDYRGNARQKNA